MLRFLTPPKRAQLREKLANPGSEQLLLCEELTLWNRRDFDERYMRRIPKPQTVSQIFDLLRQRGAPGRCYVISLDEERDGRILDLREALDAVVGVYFPALLSCIPGELAYYEGEQGWGERYILQRNPLS